MAITRKEFTKSTITTVLTAGQFWGTWMALGQGNHYAWNVIVFVAWLSFALSVFGVFVGLHKYYQRQTRTAYSAKLSLITDIAMALFFAAFGHFFYACLTMTQQLLEQFCYETEKPAEKVQGA